MPSEFVHLHVHTQYSFLVSTVKVKPLAARVKALGMSAVAITDHANMFGVIKHYTGCKAQGVQPILGCEINVAEPSGAVTHLPLLAADVEGYKNLVRLVSFGFKQPASDRAPSVTAAQVAENSGGLIALSGCMNGPVSQAILEHGEQAGYERLAALRDVFTPERLFVELQDHGLPEQPILNRLLLDQAKKLDVLEVATNCVHFPMRSDGEAHLYLECMRRGRQVAEERQHHHGSFEMYLKSPDEMASVFADLPSALSNTLRVAEMCQGLELQLGRPMLPTFPVPEGFDAEGYFRHIAREGLERRFATARARGQSLDESAYRQRLEHELDVIVGMEFPGYFLIVWDFIREAKQKGIPVGPGRGSGAGSLVAYALEITELDPIPYNLLFERFLNPERISMPDFDIDFCMSRRDEVIAYVASKYGTDSVGQIATFQNLKARSIIKDVARTMGIAAPEAQRIASLVHEKGPGQTYTISEALEVEPKLKALYDGEPQIHELLTQAEKLEGLTRHAGMHAAGVVISEGPLYDHVPCFDNDDNLVTQYDKDDVEAAGLVKFDFLGLKTLTVIEIAQRLVNARPDRKDDPIDVSAIALDDRSTYQLISSGETVGVFQLESSGMQQLLRGLKPDCFEDVVAAVALYRPGPLGTGMIDDFIGGKHGRKPIRKLHPLVDEALAPTYGVPVYQEQVMQIAQRLAGYSLGGADMLRRAMGKKKLEEMERQQATFIEGAKNNGVSEEQALSIFKEIEGFASYGFNKSHSAAYAVLTYQTAYLKTHYPAEFFAALMTADKDKIEKVVRMIAEARAWGVKVLSADINASELDFTVVYRHPAGNGPGRGPGKLKDRTGPEIRFGLGAVRGVGEGALETVFQARTEGGQFRDLFDFAARVDARRLNKGVLESLVQCGAFDEGLSTLGVTRARAFAAIDRALERSRAASRDRSSGQTTMFGMFEAAAPAMESSVSDYPSATEWDRMELLAREKQALGCYVSGHPLNRYGNKLGRIGVVEAASVAGAEAWSVVSVAGMVENYKEKIFRGGSGGKAAFFELEDRSGRVKAKVRGDAVDTYGPMLTGGDPVLVSAKVSFPITDEPDEDAEPTLLVNEVVPLSDAVRNATRAVALHLGAEHATEQQLEALRAILGECPGACPVELVLALPDGARAVMQLVGTRIEPTDSVLGGIERVFGDSVAELR